MEKARAKRRKVVKKFVLPPPIPLPIIEDSDSGSYEPLARKVRKTVAPSTVEPTTAYSSSTLVDEVRQVAKITERPTEVVDQPVVRAIEEEAQRPIEEEVDAPIVLLAEEPTSAPVDNLNPTLGIMNVVQAVNEEAREEVNAPIFVESDKALTAQFDSMLEEPIARGENLETTHAPDEEDHLEADKRRVLLWIEWRVSNLTTIKARMHEMETEES